MEREEICISPFLLSLQLVTLSPFPHSLSISSFCLDFFSIFSFSLHFLTLSPFPLSLSISSHSLILSPFLLHFLTLSPFPKDISSISSYLALQAINQLWHSHSHRPRPGKMYNILSPFSCSLAARLLQVVTAWTVPGTVCHTVCSDIVYGTPYNNLRQYVPKSLPLNLVI